MAKIAHDPPLGSGEAHLLQARGDRLVRAPMEHLHQMAVMLHGIHLHFIKCSKLPKYYHTEGKISSPLKRERRILNAMICAFELPCSPFSFDIFSGYENGRGKY